MTKLPKLIASDMDGTLLDDDACLPRWTFELVEELQAKGCRFVAASGRRYDTLREFFGPVADKIDYVASNGAQVYSQGKILSRDVFGYSGLSRLSSFVEMFDDMHLVVDDEVYCYLLDAGSFYSPELDKDLPNPVETDGLPDPSIDIVKVCVYCDGNPMDSSYVLSRELGDEYVFAPSGRQWIDVMQRGVSKATGLSLVLSMYGIDPADAVAFGDSMNDYEMFKLVGESVAVDGARPVLKQIATRTIGSNIDWAVQKELQRIASL